MIRAAVALHPLRTALRFQGESVSYADFDRMANAVALALREQGIGKGALVGVAIERSIEMVAAMVGVMYSGAAYVPLDPSYPVERLQLMCEDASIQWVLTRPQEHARLAAELPADLRYQMVDRQVLSDLPLDIVGLPSDTAYVIFTSGSTGRPKGAINGHAGVVNCLNHVREVLSFTAEDRYLLKAPCGFDVSVHEMFLPLTSGACVVIADPGRQGDGPYLVDLVQREGVTAIGFVPTMLRSFLDVSGVDRCGTLRQADLIGEALPFSLVERFFGHLPGCALTNLYGPTEAAVTVSHWHCAPGESRGLVPIGFAHANTALRVLDEAFQEVAPGEIGELFIGGVQVGLGYIGRPELTRERFIDDPFEPGAKLYRTGDLVRVLDDGAIDWLARTDQQVKVRGFRIELGEIEAVLEQHPAVAQAAVLTHEFAAQDVRLVAYFQARDPDLSTVMLREHLAERLPEYMVPAHWVPMDVMPQLPNGKLDRKALPLPSRNRPDLSVSYAEPEGSTEALCCRLFGEVLSLDGVGRDDNFFELGGYSMLAVRLLERLAAEHGRAPSAPTMFANPTPAGLARALDGHVAAPQATRAAPLVAGSNVAVGPIAIVGMAGRFPGAGDVDQLWRNLLAGVDGITHFQEHELDPSVSETERHNPAYVKARGVLNGVEMFDAAFFGISPREAELIDPQHRLFLEACWECIEGAGYNPQRTPGSVGVFGGTWSPSYLKNHVLAHPRGRDPSGALQVNLGNDADYFATRVAHRLNLKGPAISVHTACSTSLVAIVQAMDSLRLGRCDMALAGGASVQTPCATGYLHQEGAMFAPDARTRPFDAQAQGTVFCDGVAVVLLKRLADAQADGDHIVAVLRGGALNNDGGGKASYSAPSVDGQQAVIELAHRDAGVDARSISYVEAHGTATPLGDPVEVEALTRAFRASTSDQGFCRLGSIKSHIGHTIAAAGAAGVIKTALALAHEKIPGTLHFQEPNPRLALDQSPFTVTADPSPWPRQAGQPRRAGVSSFGVGGTNAHVVMEEAPATSEAPDTPGAAHVLKLSARSEAALAEMAERLAQRLAQAQIGNAPGALRLRDVAHTLEVGRARFEHRLSVAADGVAGAVEALRTADHPMRRRGRVGRAQPKPALLFPGQGSQYLGMGRALHAAHAEFRLAFDQSAHAVHDETGLDLTSAVFGGDASSLAQTRVTQPALFAVEYGLGRLWLSRGVKPAAMVGHSVGEFVAAALAGVMSAGDAARLVARRGELMQAQAAGSMLSVRAAAADIAAGLPPELTVAAENAPALCVIAGPTEAVQSHARTLEAQGIACRLLQTSHAFHSAMMDPALGPFETHVRKIRLAVPTERIVSSLTGLWLTDEEATDPMYWTRHLRGTVRFSSAIGTALDAGINCFVEAGPRASLSALVQQRAKSSRHVVSCVASLADAVEQEVLTVAAAAGALWTQGLTLTTPDDRTARRVPLPTYPFERQRHWIDAPSARDGTAMVPGPAVPRAGVAPPVSTDDSLSAEPMNTTTASPPRARFEQIAALIDQVAGIDVTQAEPDTSFIELGLDSLSLTQVAMQLKQSMGLEVSFRQLMESFRSMDSLVRHADAVLPALVPTQVPALTSEPSLPRPMPLPSAPAVATGAALDVHELIRQQTLLMSQQLALLAQWQAGSVTPPGAGAGRAAVTSGTIPAPVPKTASMAPVAVAQPSDDGAVQAGSRMLVDKPFGASARIATGPHTGTSPEQQQWIADFTARYNARSGRSKSFSQEHRKAMADPRVVTGFNMAWKDLVYPILVDRSKGAYMWDIDGNEYIDMLSCFGANLLGYQPDFLKQAMKDQLDRGIEVGPQHPLTAEVAELMLEFTGMERVGFCNTGSEAVMGAMRCARTVTGRKTIAIFTNSYHGIFDEVVVRGTRQLRSVSAAPGILASSVENVLVLDYGSDESLRILRERGGELAAIMIESVQNKLPTLQPREFVRSLREIADEAGCALIFDEVITGFRIGPGGAQEMYGVKGDLAAYGKIIGGGLPFAAIAGSAKWMDALDGGHWQFGDDSVPEAGVTYFAGTFVRHPLALAAAKATLGYLKAQGPALYERINGRTQKLVERLNAAFAVRGAPVKAVHCASAWRLVWGDEQKHVSLFYYLARFHGLHVYEQFGHFVTEPMGERETDRIFEVYTQALDELMALGMITPVGAPAAVQPTSAVSRPSPAERSAAHDPANPPVPGARLGKTPEGQPAWFVPNPASPGKYLKVDC